MFFQSKKTIILSLLFLLFLAKLDELSEAGKSIELSKLANGQRNLRRIVFQDEEFDDSNKEHISGERIYGRDESEIECGNAQLNELTRNCNLAKREGYIIQGENQKLGEWPSFARLAVRFDRSNQFCGGVLLNSRQVLTSAYCLRDLDGSSGYVRAQSVSVVFGKHRKDTLEPTQQNRTVSSICVSDSFNRTGNFENDYAVLQLEKDLRPFFGDYIAPACLPKTVDRTSREKKCFFIGLGLTKKDLGGEANVPANVVQKLQVKLSDKTACAKAWKADNRQLDESQICFESFNRAKTEASICDGDKGGPVLCLSAFRRWTVVGIASFGTLSCSNNKPNVFLDVESMLYEMRIRCKI